MTPPLNARPQHLALWLLSSAALLLSGCGSVVGALVPPQTVTNPAGLTGATLAASGALQAESVKGSVLYNTETTLPRQSFGDIKYPDNVPFGIRPHALTFNTSLASAVVSGVCSMPGTFTLTLKSVKVTVKDASNTASVLNTPNLMVTLTKGQTSLAGTSYTIAANTLALSADSASTSAALTVLTSGGTNDASLDAQLSASADGLAGCQLTLKLGETNVVLSSFS
jgi:hypothetical protein